MKDDWLAVARSRIQERIEKYSQGEIRFNLMALIGDRRKGAAEKLATYAASRQLLEETAGSSPTEMQQLQMLQIDEEIRRYQISCERTCLAKYKHVRQNYYYYYNVVDQTAERALRSNRTVSVYNFANDV